jgi:histidyl-tRNA synthetase
MSDKQSTKPPSGTRDFLPDEIRRREYVIDVIRRVYESYGFEPLETPAFENIETLLGKYGEEGNKLIFKILKRGEHEKSGEADLALRYDLTVPLARVVAQYQNELPKFFKRYQIQPVWRADRPAKGRFREFFQCDIDSLGSVAPAVEAEILGAVSEVLLALGFTDFVIRLNDRKLLTALMHSFAIDPSEQGNVLITIDKLDKIGIDGVMKELESRGVDELGRKAMFRIFGQPQSDFDTIERLLGGNALNDVREIVALTADTPAAGRIRIDPSLARGLSYYTGAIMEVGVSDLAGSLGGGGRYDNLIGMFLGRDIPACGFSLGLERIIVVMTERNMFPPHIASGGVDVLVTMWDDASLRAEAVRLAAELRGRGLRVELYPEPDKIGRQFKYADERHARFVIVQGENERAAGTVTIKNLATGTQESLARTDAATFIARTVNTSPEPRTLI